MVREYSGSEYSTTYQDTTMTYDGHGRILTSHKPEQRDSSNNLKYSAYSYNPDDSILSMTDGRGVVTNYTYNNRGLPTNISWNVGSTAVATTGAVALSYDNLGNRTQMTDGLGTQAYSYDSLSRITSESRTFTNLGTYTIDYTYTLGGQVKSYGFPSEPTRTITYAFDKTGRVTDITGGGFGGFYNYLTGIQYRAFDGPKSGSYGSGKTLTQAFNDRLNISNYTVSGSTADTSYGYDNDGSVKTVTDNLDGRFDRLYRSDFAGRLALAYSGLEARDEMQTSNDRPFRQTYGYNAFSNLTGRTMTNWAVPVNPVSDSFVNNRKQGSGPLSITHDNDGRETFATESVSGTPSQRVGTTFDAAGRRIGVTEEDYDAQVQLWRSRWIITQGYDGDGQRLVQQENGASWPTPLLRSSVMNGAVLAELRFVNGTWYKDAFVYAGGEIIAQQKDNPTTADEVKWLYTNPITGAQRGAVQTVPDPLGTDQGLSQRQPDPPIYSGDSGIMDPGRYADAFNGRFCSNEGAIIPCDHAWSLLSGGAADIDFRRTDPMMLARLGIVARWNGVSGRQPPAIQDPNTTYGDGGTWEYFFVGAVRQQDRNAECDNRIARLFGDDEVVVGTAVEPDNVDGNPNPGRQRIGLKGEDPTRRIHIFSNANGSPRSQTPGFSGNLYAPAGFSSLFGKADPADGTTYSNIQVIYGRGALARYGFADGLRISFPFGVNGASRPRVRFSRHSETCRLANGGMRTKELHNRRPDPSRIPAGFDARCRARRCGV